MFKKTIALLIAFCMTGQSVIFAAPVGQKDGKVPLEQVQKTARTDANKLWREHEVEIGILAGGVALVTPLLIAKNKKIKELNKKLGGIEKDLSLERVSRNDSEKYYQTELTYLKQEYEAEIEALTELYDDVVEYLQNEAQTYKIAAIEAEGRAEGKVAAMQANMQEQLDWWHQFYGRMYEMQQNRYEKELNLIIEQATANETSSAEIESLKASYEEQLAQTRKELARTKTALSDAKGSLKDVEKFENLYNEQVTKVEKLEAQIKELESRAISPDELARLTKASKELERIEKEAAQKIAAAEQRATYAEGLLKTFDNPYRYGKDLVGVRMVDGVWVKQDHLRSIASAWREEAISNQGVIKILRKQIADMQKVPFSQVQGAASKENVAALRSRLKQSEAYQDIVLSARREMTVSRDALSEALLSSIERGDGEVFKQAVADLLSDTKARETSGELKQIFQQLRTAYQKQGGYDAEYVFDEVLPKLNQVVKNEIARGTNGFVARSVGKALLKRIGLMGIGVLAIVGVSAATASTASAQDKALARRLAENPMLFINANTQELAEIEKSELASQTAREIAEIIHIAATELNGEDRATVAQQQRQENLQKREAKKAITSSLHKVKAY